MESDDFSKRIRDERSVRSQRDAAESAVPGERLRREIREAFERQDARDRAEEDAADRPAAPGRDEP